MLTFLKGENDMAIYTGKMKKGKVIETKDGIIKIRWSQGRSNSEGVYSASIKSISGLTEYIHKYYRISDITQDAKKLLKEMKLWLRWVKTIWMKT